MVGDSLPKGHRMNILTVFPDILSETGNSRFDMSL
jgi:hypothetical protein